MTDTEIRLRGMELLANGLGEVEAERFIALMMREPFDYTQWRQNNLPQETSVAELSRLAMKHQDMIPPSNLPPLGGP
ncbi:hypothetical protein D5085_16575 [Ectothiorhodospiraceae bacterium BW-2]|nr:hypothetical protein D5085_16575 [Ectothiorhodospiraceae bacterium BW-2]